MLISELVTGTASNPELHRLTLRGYGEERVLYLDDNEIHRLQSICTCHSPRPLDQLLFAIKTLPASSEYYVLVQLLKPIGLR